MYRDARNRVTVVLGGADGELPEEEVRIRVGQPDLHETKIRRALELHAATTRAPCISIVRSPRHIRYLERNELIAYLDVEQCRVVADARHGETFHACLERRRELRLQLAIEAGIA